MRNPGFGHGGEVRALAARAGCEVAELADFSASINPLGPPDWLRGEVSAALSGLRHYPDPYAGPLCAAAAARFGCAAPEAVAGNGSTELLYALPRALGLTRALVPAPGYADYRRACELAGLAVDTLPLDAARGFAPDLGRAAAWLRRHGPGAAVFLGQPNNPTGRTVDPEALRALAREFPGAWVVVDEAFADFVPGLGRLAGARPGNVVVLWSMTKFYALPGLRLGLGFAAPGVAAAWRAQLPPWSVNGLAQAVGLRALGDGDYARRTLEETARLRAELAGALEALPGLRVFPGEANFLLCRLEGAGADAAALAGRLLEGARVAVRVCANFEGLDGRHFRVAVRGGEDNGRLVRALGRELGGPAPALVRRRTPALMVQGCSSNAGKSVLAAALCRILLREGYAVAPFKSQNMSLNSFVTRDGGEMGRAQATQARACRLEPDVRMNPVLLKPVSDRGSQVIVLGRPVGTMRVGEYVRYKPEAFAQARAAYDALAAEHEVMILEGAGSPAEINLRAHDMVNMAMAGYARARVLLAGDIDRGGVFAAFTGTMELLAEWERALVAGFVVNRFRGDESLLGPALEAVTARTGVPFAGVVPFLPDLGLPEEDSVSFKSGALDMRPGPGREVEVACVDLPHVSNFTDLDALAGEPDVWLRVVRRAGELGRPHAVILPGSRNTVADLDWLRASGLGAELAELAAAGRTEIVGLCGGLQMLGREVADPLGLEGGGVRPGLGLLGVDTELAGEKTLVRAAARHVPTGLALAGYEIHHGRTVAAPGAGAAVCVERADGQPIGFAAPGGLVWGSYLHGLFDADGFRRTFLDGLRRRAGLAPVGRVVAPYDVEPALERLADVVAERLGLATILRAAGLGG
ncbi:cobyric acid synthase [Desulfocurvus sp.]|uniref:cobyric acid synthase n=1 Tax=Desulfocurvus sp. TaxID=2871698 RepID=UPI0025BAB176|nr:cobyric acid synthase [Desulfocurvus sp.]MCK9241006.1 cobyric acid synthase [Desulfocurvus sp.]